MLSDADKIALFISLKLAAVTTGVLLLLGTPLAWWLARTRSKMKFLPEALVMMPLMLPPTVLGFYLLVLLGPEGPLGKIFEWFGLAPPAFTFTGLVIGSVIYSLPFVVQPLQNAFSGVKEEVLEVASTLRASRLNRFFTVVVPLSLPGFIGATVLGFAHTVGEFGVVLMIGGNIPGKTQVISIAIYDHVESLAFDAAHWLSGGLLVFSFMLIVAVQLFQNRYREVRR